MADAKTTARVAWAVNAGIAWLGVALNVLVSAFGGYGSAPPEPGLYGGNPPGLAGLVPRVIDTLSYFTLWSNVVVAVSTTLLALHPERETPVRRALRLSGLIMITITAIVYAVLLAPTTVVQGWSHLTNPLVHIITPAVTVLVWLVWGPRGWIHWRTVLTSLIIPFVWVAYMLIRGAIGGTYPYGFANAAVLGYQRVALTMGLIFAFGLLIATVFGLIDRVLTRRSRRA